MSKIVYCMKCGRALPIHREPMPQYGRIIELVEPHKCGKVVEPDLGKAADISTKPLKDDYEFIQKLNDLSPPTGDKRPKEHLRNELVTSTAPMSLQDVTRLANSVPEGSINEEPEGEEDQ